MVKKLGLLAVFLLAPILCLAQGSGQFGSASSGGTVTAGGVAAAVSCSTVDAFTYWISTGLVCDPGITTNTTGQLTATGGLVAASDGVHPGDIFGVGNTTAPTVSANTFHLTWPNATTFTAYGWQFPTANPGAANFVSIGAPDGTTKEAAVSYTGSSGTGLVCLTTSCNLVTPTVGTDNAVAGTMQLANAVAAAHTIFGSGATTTNTIQGFATVPTTGHLLDCTVSATTCLLHDSGIVTANVLSSAQYKTMTCEGGVGDGLNAIPSGTYLQSVCYNGTGVTVTITGLKCFTDNGGTSTMNAAGNTLGALLTGAVTCTASYAAGTQSANVALTSGDYIKFTFVADGTSKQTDWVVLGTY